MNDDLERRSDGYFGYPVLGIGTMVVAAVAMVIRLVSFSAQWFTAGDGRDLMLEWLLG
jgi:hypothetical protein